MGYPYEKAPQTTYFHEKLWKFSNSCWHMHYSIVEVVNLQLDTKCLCFVQGAFHRAAWFALGFENLPAPSSGCEEQRYPLHR